jgi:hypothetical protein
VKCTGINEFKSERIYQIFLAFKAYSLSQGRNQFKLEGFVGFVNSNDFDMFGYKWHQNEADLEFQNPGRTAISIFHVCECYANASKSTYCTNENGERVRLLNKLGPKTYEFLG